jgi:hypothetical protein
MGNAIPTVYCRCCADFRPYSVVAREIDGETCWDLCCQDCYCQIAAFAGACPFGVMADLARREAVTLDPTAPE